MVRNFRILGMSNSSLENLVLNLHIGRTNGQSEFNGDKTCRPDL